MDKDVQLKIEKARLRYFVKLVADVRQREPCMMKASFEQLLLKNERCIVQCRENIKRLER